MTVINNAVPERDFTRVPNEWLRDRALSYRAKGVLAYIASHAASYSLTMEQIIAEGSEGRQAVQTAVKELIAHGYLERVEVRQRGRIVRHDYVVRAPGAQEPANGPAADGFLGTGGDQGKRPDSAGGTADQEPVSGESATKKTNPPTGGEKTNEKTKPSASPRGARLPEDWKPSPDLGAWCLEKLVPGGRWSEESRRFVLAQTDMFRDHFRANGKPYKDWDATWRNWMRRAFQRDWKGPRPGPAAPTSGAPVGQFKTAAEKSEERAAQRMTRAQMIDHFLAQKLPLAEAITRADAELAKGLAPCTVSGYIDGEVIESTREVTS